MRRPIQGDPEGIGPGLGSLRFAMFHQPAWAVSSYSSGPQPGELPKSSLPNPVRDLLGHPVELPFTYEARDEAFDLNRPLMTGTESAARAL